MATDDDQPSPPRPDAAGDLPMPPHEGDSGSAVQGQVGAAADPDAPPPSFGRQMAQLVVIPAVIAIAAIGVFFMFGILAAGPDDIDDLLTRLRQPSGYGRDLPGGVQDPRYKDRWLAAMNISRLIETIDDPAEREKLSVQLVQVLNENVRDDEEMLAHWLLVAIGRLGQEGGMAALLSRLHFKADEPVAVADGPSKQQVGDKVRGGAILGVMSWPDEQTARDAALGGLVRRLNDPFDTVRTHAARAIFKLAGTSDEHMVRALRSAASAQGTDAAGRDFVHSRWHAQITLAALGDTAAAAFVANHLLNRQELATLPAETGSGETMNRDDQDRVMAAAMLCAVKITDEQVWDRIRWLAENDPSVSIRKTAIEMLDWKRKQP